MTHAGDCAWQRFRSPVVREMAWCLFSPPVLDRLPPVAPAPWPIGPDRGAAELLTALDRDSAPLEAHLASGNDKRLGARFEAFWTYFLEAHPRLELLAHNLPIYRQGQTLGALDLLFADNHTGTVFHGEIAVKFYLYRPGGTGTDASQWIGPNPDDNLHLKLERLRNHQLPISGTAEATESLSRAGLPPPHRRAALIKGCLFRPRGERIALPSECHSASPTGEWLYVDELPALLAQSPGKRWAILNKPAWMVPDQAAYGSGDTLAKRLAQHPERQPVMVGCNDDASGETPRYMVVPRGWPRSSLSPG